jgi:hypothetical protein
VIGRGRLCLEVLLLATLAGGVASGGCAARPPSISGAVTERSEALALAWNVLAENKDVAGILAIKSVTPETGTLIREIAEACRRTAGTIERIAKAEGLPLGEDGLPVAETRVRASIRARMTRELLLASGPTFERSLLLTQVEALGYASNLLEEVAAQLRAAERPGPAIDIEAEATRFAELRGRVIRRLRVEDASAA